MAAFVCCHRFGTICSFELDLCHYVGEPCLCAWDPGVPESGPGVPNRQIWSPVTEVHPIHEIGGSHSSPMLEFGIHVGKETVPMKMRKSEVFEERKRPLRVEPGQISPNFLSPLTKGKFATLDRAFGVQVGKDTTQVISKHVPLYHGQEHQHTTNSPSIMFMHSPSTLPGSSLTFKASSIDQQNPIRQGKQTAHVGSERTSLQSKLTGPSPSTRTQIHTQQQLTKSPTSSRKPLMKKPTYPHKKSARIPMRAEKRHTQLSRRLKGLDIVPAGLCRFETSSRRKLRCTLDGLACSHQKQICTYDLQICPCDFDPRSKTLSSSQGTTDGTAPVERREVSWSACNAKSGREIAYSNNYSRDQSSEARTPLDVRSQDYHDPYALFDENSVAPERTSNDVTEDSKHEAREDHDVEVSDALEIVKSKKPASTDDGEMVLVNTKRDMPWGVCKTRQTETHLSCFFLSRYKCSHKSNRGCQYLWEECQCDFTSNVPDEMKGRITQAQKVPSSVGNGSRGPVGKCRFQPGPAQRPGHRLIRCYYKYYACSNDFRQCHMAGDPCRCSYIPQPVLKSLSSTKESIKPQRAQKALESIKAFEAEKEHKGSPKPRLSKLSHMKVTTKGTMIIGKAMQAPYRITRKQHKLTVPLRSPKTHVIDLTSEGPSQSKESSLVAELEKIPSTKENIPPLRTAGLGHMGALLKASAAAAKQGLTVPIGGQAFPEGQAANPQLQVQGVAAQKRTRVKGTPVEVRGRKKPLPKKRKEGS